MNVLKLAILHFKRMIKYKSVIFAMLLMPTLITCTVAFLSKGENRDLETTYRIAIVNNDKGDMGKELIKDLKSSNKFIVKEKSIEDAKSEIKANRIAAAVVIPEDFTKALNSTSISPKVDILKLKEGNMDAVVSQIINNFISQRLLTRVTSESVIKSVEKLNITSEELQNKFNTAVKEKRVSTVLRKVINEGKHSLSGVVSTNFIVTFITYSIAYIMSQILEMKKNKTLRRSLSTPNKNSSIIGGLLLAMLLLFYLQSIILIGTTDFILKMYWGKSMLAIFLIFTAFILVTLSLGILASRWVNNDSHIPLVLNLICMPTSIVSGCFVPLEFMPDIFKRISYFTPQRWALIALNDVALKNAGVVDILPEVGVLLLFAFAFFTAGSASLQKIIKE